MDFDTDIKVKFRDEIARPLWDDNQHPFVVCYRQARGDSFGDFCTDLWDLMGPLLETIDARLQFTRESLNGYAARSEQQRLRRQADASVHKAITGPG